ncbi:hypothetical protein TWF481_011003 [Arthrobotrys musiformis]|uniref:Uncharacterized protein n=1 Tax=Arthrobotrys musiformis TaxID=47236 RepID=A0AAV9VXB2_9PEZI
MRSTLLPLFLLLTTALAADLPALAHPPQRHGGKKYTVAKRQSGGSRIGIGSSCSAITGNPDDVICEIDGDNVSCAPVCCEKGGVFVDGCPAGDQCVFEGETLKCCPVGKSCGPRPTACANFGAPSVQKGQAICPSATPTCTTRADGGIACTGEGPAATSTPSAVIARPNVPIPTDIVTTAEPATTSEGTESTGMESTVMEEPTLRFSVPASGTMVLPESAMPTEGRAAGGEVPGSRAARVVSDNVCGVVVAVVVALGIFL